MSNLFKEYDVLIRHKCAALDWSTYNVIAGTCLQGKFVSDDISITDLANVTDRTQAAVRGSVDKLIELDLVQPVDQSRKFDAKIRYSLPFIEERMHGNTDLEVSEDESELFDEISKIDFCSTVDEILGIVNNKLLETANSDSDFDTARQSTQRYEELIIAILNAKHDALIY